MRLDYELKKTDDAITGLLKYFDRVLSTEQYNKLIVLIRQAHWRGMIAKDIETRALHNRLTKEESDDV